MEKIAVHLESVSRAFKGKPALQDINLTLPKGEKIALTGPDGAGKTTLIRLIAGLLLPDKGDVFVLGFNTKQNAQNIHDQIGYMPQRFSLYEDLTVLQNLHFYADIQNLSDAQKKETVESLLDATHLTPFIHRPARALSGGMKQKLSLSCALIRTPSILLLDEPTAGIDPLSRREIWALLNKLPTQKLTMLWSTSYLPEANIADLAILMQEGKIVESRREKINQLMLDTPSAATLTSPLASNGFTISPSSKSVIEAKSLTKVFGSFKAVDNISFEVRPGEIFGLLGPNGAGKSTTFKMLCGLLEPTEGQAFVNSVSLQSAPAQARSQIGYMAQKFSLYGNLSVRQNLLFFSGIYNLSGKKQQDAIEKMVGIFHLEPFLNQMGEELPAGYRQRLALACAIMHQPKVLFLDEPTSGVDPAVREEFWSHMQALANSGCAVLVSTHYMEEALYCNRIALIHQSHLIYQGTPEELQKTTNASDLEEAFIQFIERQSPQGSA